MMKRALVLEWPTESCSDLSVGLKRTRVCTGKGAGYSGLLGFQTLPRLRRSETSKRWLHTQSQSSFVPETEHTSQESETDAQSGVEPGRPPSRRWNTIFGWLLTVVLFVGMVWIVPLRDVWQALRQATLMLLLLSLAPSIVNLLLRGGRWALLFRPHHRISGNAALGPVLIGLGLNAVLPGRIGDITRATLGSRKFSTSFPFTASTVVGERLLDALVLLIFLGGSLFVLPPVDTTATVNVLGYTVSFEMLASVSRKLGLFSLILIGLVILLVNPTFHRLFLRLLMGVPGVGPRLEKWVEHAMREFGRGLTALRHPSILARALLLSLVIWMALAFTNLVVAQAIPGINLTFVQALAVTAISVGASFMPSAPGAWGVYEAGMLLALGLIQVIPEPGVGIAFALASHMSSYLPIVVLGAVAGFQEGSFKKRDID